MARILLILSLLILSGCQKDEEYWCSSNIEIKQDISPFFENSEIKLSQTAKLNRAVAVGCHNCYANDSSYLSDTTDKIQHAITASADVLELDFLFKEGRSYPVITHEKDSSEVQFVDLITSPILVDAKQPLFIEIKNEFVDEEILVNMLELLKEQINDNGEYAFFNPARFTVFRNIHGFQVLAQIRDLLQTKAFIDIKPYVKLSRIHFNQSVSNLRNKIEGAAKCQFDMVEFDVQSGVSTVKELSEISASLGLAVGVFTLNSTNYKASILALKEDVDVVMVEAKLKSSQSNLYKEVKKLISL